MKITPSFSTFLSIFIYKSTLYSKKSFPKFTF